MTWLAFTVQFNIVSGRSDGTTIYRQRL